MSTNHPDMPRPRRRLLRTMLGIPRKIRAFSPRIPLEQVAEKPPEPAETAHWGEVILLEDLTVVQHRDGTSSWLTRLVTMPWGDQNLAEWDEVARVYQPKKWRPTVRRAVVHLPDGTQRKAKRTDRKVSPTDRVLTLSFAPLRPGVIVEFEEQHDHYRIDDVGPAVWAQFLMQALFPCRRRRITVAVAEPFHADFKLHNCPWQPAESRERGYRVYRWDVRDVDGIEADMWTPPPRDFAPWIDFSTLPTWKPVVSHYRKELAPAAGTPEPVKQLARELAEDCQTDREKVRAVFRYAARDVRYGRHPSEMQMHSIREAHSMLEDLRGDCKDKSSLMVSTLSEMNIPAQVAVLATAQNGRTPNLPSLRFDHAIVVAQVDSEEIWMDPASGPYTFGDLPQLDQDVKALVLAPGEPRFIDVPKDPLEHQRVERICRGELDESGNYSYQADVTARGERAAMYRMTLSDRNDEHCRRMVQQSVAEERPGAEVDAIRLGDADDLNREVSYGYRVKLNRWGRRIKDLLLLRVPWAEQVEFTGPVSAAERLQPLQTPPVLRLFERHEIAMPKGFAGYALPMDVKHECRWASYVCRVTCEDGKLLCERRMDTFGGIVPTESFAEFRAFWEACAVDDKADVVLMRHEEA